MKRKMQIKLLPCPFCGSKDIEHESMMGVRWLRCQSCSATGGWIWSDKLPEKTLSDPNFQNIWALETEKAWNNRPNNFSSEDGQKRVDTIEKDVDLENRRWKCGCGIWRDGSGSCETCLQGFSFGVPMETKDICKCGHEKEKHGKMGLRLQSCLHRNIHDMFDCACEKYTPIPAPLPNDTSSDPLCPVCKEYLIEDDGTWFCSNEKCEKYK